MSLALIQEGLKLLRRMGSFEIPGCFGLSNDQKICR